MANEITAEMLADEMTFGNGEYLKHVQPEEWREVVKVAKTHLLATRALASLQAERATDAPDRVRCWYIQGVGLTMAKNKADAHEKLGHTVTEGYSTAKGSRE